MEEQQCALEGCEELFIPRVHNQRFHDKACCRVYTNARILEQYHIKKNQTLTGRSCAEKHCSVHLSQYNESNKCSVHERKDFVKKLNKWGIQLDE